MRYFLKIANGEQYYKAYSENVDPFGDGWVEVSESEYVAAELYNPSKPDSSPTVEELAAENKLLKQRVSALTDQQSFYEDCIAEMAAVVYA